MHSCKPGRKVAAFGQREGNAGSGKDVRAEISVDRNQRAQRNHDRSAVSQNNAGHVRQWTSTVRRVGKNTHHDPLNERVDHGANHEG